MEAAEFAHRQQAPAPGEPPDGCPRRPRALRTARSRALGLHPPPACNAPGLATHKGLNAINLLGQLNAGHFGVMGSLGTQPVARAQSQKAAEAQIRVCTDGALTCNDLADPRCRHVNGLCQPVLADA